MKLLSKTRQLQYYVQREMRLENSDRDQITQILGELTASNVYLINLDGSVIGQALDQGLRKDPIQEWIDDGSLSAEWAEQLKDITQMVTNINLLDSGFDNHPKIKSFLPKNYTTLIPIIGEKKRIGTVIFCREFKPYSDEDLILGEYVSLTIGLEMLRRQKDNT